MKKIKYIDWIEYSDGHFISIGKGAPCRRKIQIRVPKFIARLLHHII